MIVIFLSPGRLQAQQYLSTSSLVKRIQQLQVTRDSFFSPGMFESYRRYHKKKDAYKPDDNIFFTAIALFALQQLKNDLPAEQQLQVEAIVEKGVQPFNKYVRAGTGYTYNFWQTDTPVIFPNSGFLNWFNKSNSMPDDADDTVMMLMAMQAADSTAKKVHALLQQHANLYKKKIKNTFKEYRNIAAYSTWFGKKMPIDFDVCVLTNILYFVNSYGLPWSHADSASAELMRRIIVNRHYLSKAPYVSPHYNRPQVILYHFARLLGRYSIPALDSLKPRLISDARALLQSSTEFMDKVILNTALIRLGAAPEQVAIEADLSFNYIEDTGFCFFIGDIATYLPNFFRKFFASTGLGKFYFYAPAYNDVLLLEYLVEQQRYDSRNGPR
ncbi:hypothetical protein [Foetidibacter luteolus]|uniref:hypothetical protein n=1 Tax=Foetidibacter luteolus TaxID=2608880 RepID=UPI00129A1C35|nr:hypothetical protein [Foetidibacter luteolus]